MVIEMRKIGSVLDNRPDGREAFLAIRPILPKHHEPIVVDFQGIEVLTPGFADEFITPLIELFRGNLSFMHTGNITVRKTLEFFSEQWPKNAFTLE